MIVIATVLDPLVNAKFEDTLLVPAVKASATYYLIDMVDSFANVGFEYAIIQ